MVFPQAFIGFLEDAVGRDGASVALEAMETSPSVSVRLNPFKRTSSPLPVLEGAVRLPWCHEGYLLKERPSFTLDPLFHAGAYYVQDSSAMFVGELFSHILPVKEHIRVLDLCAAPGGKTTDMAARLRKVFGDSFLLVANEVMRQRATVLSDNVAKWGDPNIVVTSADPAAFARLAGFFDVIVADVPCSGEGMFRKDQEALEQWSEENVQLCAARQKRILADVWPALAAGGVLVYSTCTFNRLENDHNVKWACDTLGAEVLDASIVASGGVLKTEYGYSLLPGLVPGEGQYCSAIRRLSENVHAVDGRNRTRPDERLGRFFRMPVTISDKSGLLVAVPCGAASEIADISSCVRVISAGCAVGTIKGRDLIPDADLALCIAMDDAAFRSVDVGRRTALEYLHGDAVRLEGQVSGMLLLKYLGLSLGFVKNLGNRCNNLYPKSRRIRMDIEPVQQAIEYNEYEN